MSNIVHESVGAISKNLAVTGVTEIPYDEPTPHVWWDASASMDNFSIDENDGVYMWHSLIIINNNPPPNNETAYQITEALRPTYETNQCNGLPAIYFNGTKRFHLSSYIPFYFRYSNGYLIFIVMRSTMTGATQTILSLNEAGPIANISLSINAANQVVLTCRSGQDTGEAFSTVTSPDSIGTEWQIITLKTNFRENTMKIWYGTNPVPVAVNDECNFRAINILRTTEETSNMGISSALTTPLYGYIGEILMYPYNVSFPDGAYIDGTEQNKIITYLSNKWGISEPTSIETTPPMPYALPYNIDDLHLWHDASALNGYADGDSIAYCPDYSAYEYMHESSRSTESAKPLYKTNQCNGLPAMGFYTGASQSNMVVNLNVISDLIGAGGLTVFLVMKTTAATTLQRLISLNSYSEEVKIAIDIDTTNKINFYVRTTRVSGEEVSSVTSPSAIGTGWIIATMATDLPSKTMSLWLGTNAVPVATNNACNYTLTAFDSATDPCILGSNTPKTAPFRGYLGELIIYSRELTSEEREDIVAYLADKWGLT